MSSIIQSIRNLIQPEKPIAPGIYHYRAPQDDPRNYRLHLRVEENGEGILVVNASTVLHLNRTAAEYAYYFVQNTPVKEVSQMMTRRYHLDQEQAAIDYRNLADRILTLVETPDLDPVTFLDFERHTPFKGHISAPYRLDCALTYHLPEGIDPAFAPTQRVKRELSTAEWCTILDKAWAAGIPQIILTGGEPTLREDLAQIIARAEENGQVTGLITLGHALSDRAYLSTLLQTGLDHVMLVLDPDDQLAWAALDVSLPEDIFIAVHLTLDETNAVQIEDTLRKLAEMGLHAVSLSATGPDLEAALADARDLAANLHLELVWDLPAPYSQYNPVSLELEKGELPEAAGRAWLYVEPDGDVLPTQGYNQVLGNLLSDPWEKVWKAR